MTDWRRAMDTLCNVVGQCVNIWSLLGLIVVSIAIVAGKIILARREKRLLDFSSKYTNIHMVIAENDTRIELDLK